MLLRNPIDNVNLFSGKDWEFRAKIMHSLGTNGPSTTWQISQFVSEDEIKESPSKRSTIVKSHLAGVYRNIQERMLKEKYVEESGKKISKGNKVSLYRLSFRGSIVAFLLPLSKEEYRVMIEKNTEVNPFFRLILKLGQEDSISKSPGQLITNGIIYGLEKNMINLSSDNESIIGQSIVSALYLYMSTIERNQLMTLAKKLDQIYKEKIPSNFMRTIGQYVYLLLSPLMWDAWSKTEESQIMTLSLITDLILHPKKYQLNNKSLD